jgi:ParB family transcriptional regulator, chromosome partitioning protein
MAKPATKPTFGAGVLSGLRATAGAASGEPLFLLLDQIEEDPDQPRTGFDEAELEQLAETIRLYGVLTPVGVRKLEGDRYRLVYGARRLRASRLAEQTRIPATILSEDKAGLAVQVIENQARANLSNRDLATAVNRLFADGKKVKQIAAICNLKEYQVAAFRSVERLPPVLAQRLDHADMRAIYDLFRAWEKDGPAIEGAMPAPDVFLTITEARRIIEAVTGKASNSVFLTHGQEPVPEPATPAADIEPSASEPSATAPVSVKAGSPDVPRVKPEPLSPTKTKPKVTPPTVSEPVPPPSKSVSQLPRFVMETGDGRRGALVTDRRAQQAGCVLLEIEGGGSVEVAFSELRPIEVA